jgi:superoxide dismutase, Fe-Mn family
MTYIQPPLPYALDALTPNFSKETLEYHYGKHHLAYYDNLNRLIESSETQSLQGMTLEALIKTSSPGALFNNAGQAWNHDFFWQCLTPDQDKHALPTELESALNESFGSLETFRENFTKAAIAQFGSGWAWLVKDADGQLSIETTSNAETPLQMGKTCLLTCDVWEHAYYIDYRNRRPDYLAAFWEIVNWHFVYENFKSME